MPCFGHSLFEDNAHNLNLTVEPVADDSSADLAIHFRSTDWLHDNPEDIVLPENLKFVQDELNSIPSALPVEITLEQLRDTPKIFDELSPAQFLAILMTNRLKLYSIDGGAYEQMMEEYAYKRFRKTLANPANFVELQKFVELVNLAFSQLSVLAGEGSVPMNLDLTGLSVPAVQRIDQLITKVLDLNLFPRLIVKRQVSGHADCANRPCEIEEFARAFFSPAMNNHDRLIAAAMDSRRRNGYTIDQWLEICQKALDAGVPPGEILPVADQQLKLLITSFKYRTASFPLRQKLFDFVRQIVEVQNQVAQDKIDLVSRLILQAVDLNVRAKSSELALGYNKILAGISAGSPLDLSLRRKIEFYLSAIKPPKQTMSNSLTYRLLCEAEIARQKRIHRFEELTPEEMEIVESPFQGAPLNTLPTTAKPKKAFWRSCAELLNRLVWD